MAHLLGDGVDHLQEGGVFPDELVVDVVADEFVSQVLRLVVVHEEGGPLLLDDGGPMTGLPRELEPAVHPPHLASATVPVRQSGQRRHDARDGVRELFPGPGTLRNSVADEEIEQVCGREEKIKE